MVTYRVSVAMIVPTSEASPLKHNAVASLKSFRLFGGHRSWSSRNRTPTPLPPFAGMNSTPASSSVRRIVVRLSSRGPRLLISNSATVDRPTPDTRANRRCDHCKSPLAARHCCEFILDCNAFRYTELVIVAGKRTSGHSKY
jgi:hypothetical protein